MQKNIVEDYSLKDRLGDWFEENPKKVVCTHILENQLDIGRQDLYYPLKKLEENGLIEMIGRGECQFYKKPHNKYTKRSGSDKIPKEMNKKRKLFQKITRNFSEGEEFTTKDVQSIRTVGRENSYGLHNLINRDAIDKIGIDGKYAVFRLNSKDYNYNKPPEEKEKEKEKEKEIPEEKEPVKKIIEETEGLDKTEKMALWTAYYNTKIVWKILNGGD